MSAKQLKAQLSAYLNRVAEDEERVIIEEDGVPKAALVSVSERHPIQISSQPRSEQIIAERR